MEPYCTSSPSHPPLPSFDRCSSSTLPSLAQSLELSQHPREESLIHSACEGRLWPSRGACPGGGAPDSDELDEGQVMGGTTMDCHTLISVMY